MLTTHHSLLTPHSSLSTPHCSLLTPHSSLLTPHTSLLTPHTSLLTPHSSLLTAHCLLPPICCLLRTTHYLLCTGTPLHSQVHRLALELTDSQKKVAQITDEHQVRKPPMPGILPFLFCMWERLPSHARHNALHLIQDGVRAASNAKLELQRQVEADRENEVASMQ